MTSTLGDWFPPNMSDSAQFVFAAIAVGLILFMAVWFVVLPAQHALRRMRRRGK